MARTGIPLHWLALVLIALGLVIVVYDLPIGLAMIVGIISAFMAVTGKKRSIGRALGIDFVFFLVISIIYTFVTPTSMIFAGTQIPAGSNITVAYLLSQSFWVALIVSLIFAGAVFYTYEMGQKGKTISVPA